MSKKVKGVPDIDTAKALADAGVVVGDTIEVEGGQLVEIVDPGEIPPPDTQDIESLQGALDRTRTVLAELDARLKKIERGIQNVCDNPILKASQPELINALHDVD